MHLYQYDHYVISTDLEPDDTGFLLLFISSVSKHPRLDGVTIAFLVGEGDSRIKMMRIKKFLAEARKLGLLPLPDSAITFIQGYTNFFGSQEKFTDDGKESLDDVQIMQAKSEYPDGTLIDTHAQSRAQIKDFLALHPNTLVISVKPMQELLDIADEDASVFNSHSLAYSGSYNFRVTWEYVEDVRAVQNKHIDLIHAFGQSLGYEGFSATDTTFISEATSDLFNILEDTNAPLLQAWHKGIKLWNRYLLAGDREDFPQQLKVLAQIPDSITEEILSAEEIQLLRNPQRFVEIFNQPYTETAAGIKPMLDQLQKPRPGLSASQIADIAYLSRTVRRWKCMTEAGEQIINVDPGLMACLIDNDVATFVPVTIDFDDRGYTQLTPPTGKSHSFFVLPAGVSLAKHREYLALKDMHHVAGSTQEQRLQQLSAQIQPRQKDLYKAIHQALLNTALEVNALNYAFVRSVASPSDITAVTHNMRFFSKIAQESLINERHQSEQHQRAYDKRYGLTIISNGLPS